MPSVSFAARLLFCFFLATTAHLSAAAVLEVASVQGNVSFLVHGAGDDWRQPELQSVMAQGDRITTVGQGTAVLRMIDAGNFTIPSDSMLTVQQLDDQSIEMDLLQGSLDVQLDKLPVQKIRLATPNVNLLLTSVGHYIFEADTDGKIKTIRVSSGECQAALSNGQPLTVYSGQTAHVTGLTYTLDGPASTLTTPTPDSNRQPTPNTIAQPVYNVPAPQPQYGNPSYPPPAQYPQTPSYAPGPDPEITSLNQYGDWNQTTYGTAWSPNKVAQDWAPYTDGHWRWIDPWGWTWIDNAPWGFVTFHYGGWMRASGRWYWVPGPRNAYSPALVQWVQIPGTSYVGWFPLGPRGNAFMNRNSMTFVFSQTLVGSGQIYRSRVQVPPYFITRATFANRLAVMPTRISILGTRPTAVRPPIVVSNAVANRVMMPTSVGAYVPRTGVITAPTRKVDNPGVQPRAVVQPKPKAAAPPPVVVRHK